MKMDDKAQAGSIIQIIIVVVVLMLAALILAPLQDQAQDRIDQLNVNGTAQDAADTFVDITDASWGSLSTASIIPYVVVFVVILGLIAGLGGRRD